MKIKFFIVISCLAMLTGCASTNDKDKSCARDYWKDSNVDIFGRNNCVGKTGAWVYTKSGKHGYFCTTPNCRPDIVTCTGTCKK